MIESCRERLDRGERVDFDAEAAARPHLAARLRPAFALLARLERTFPAPAAASLVGAALGPWRVTSRLGAGGMGEVFRCEDAGGATTAVKVIHAHLLGRPGFLDRFRREALLGRRIRHDNVVATLDAADWDAAGATRHCLVMEFVEGQTLRAMLDDLGRLPEDLCRHVGREIAKGLAAIHAAGVVHRDLKPDNVIVTREHVVKVMDLGVARLVDEAARISQSSAFVGSFHYAAPEQFGFLRAAGAQEATPRSPVRAKGGHHVDGRADLFALGLVLYELATGAHPFEGDDLHVVMRRLLDETPRPAAELNPQLSPFFEEVVAKLLAKDPDARFASADEVARVLADGEESAWWAERAKAIRAATHRPLRRIRIPRETALYGRDTELATLRGLFEKAKSGDGQVLLVEGEAGIGKSRLVDEFVGALAQSGEDVNFLFGSYPPGGAATASGAFSTAYREHLGDDETSIRAALPQTPLLVPAFAALLRGDVAPEDAEKLTKDSLQTVFVHATRAFAAGRPTIVLIDDLHFAPEEGRALFTSLALAVPGHRVLLVGCARPSLDEKWVAQLAARPQTTRLAVPRLGPKELVHLLRDALKSERLAEELGVLIAVKSDGNPFFVFELLRGLRDGQFLRQRPDGTWETTQIIRDIQVPSSIAELVQARVADLDADDKNLLDVAACCGFEFDPLIVAAALGVAQIPAMQRLARIERRHRLVRSAGRRFVFDHHQVQEALYAGMPELLREPYHAAIAEAIEERSGAASKETASLDGALCADLAEHFLKGAQGERALRYLDAALTHLERNYVNDAAIRLTDRVLGPEGLVTARRRVELLLREAGWLELLGRPGAERATLDEALALADREGDASLLARTRRAFGTHLWRTSRYDDAREALRDAADLARSAGDVRTESRAIGALGTVFMSQSRYTEAQAFHERHLALARNIGDRVGESVATGNLCGYFMVVGRLAEARERAERQLALARETGDARVETSAMHNLGAVLHALGSYAEARERFERQLALARATGHRSSEGLAAGNLGNTLRSIGNYAEACAQFERCLALAREIGDRQTEAFATGFLSVTSFALGRREAARDCAERWLALARKLGNRHQESYALEALADVADAEGDVASAERRFAEALECSHSLGARAVEASVLCGQGALFARLSRHDEAHAALSKALDLARVSSLRAVEVVATAWLAHVPRGDTTRSVAAALDALASYEDRVGTRQAMQARLLAWQATQDSVHLAEAKRQLDHVVAHAPPECRESMIANDRLHREIATAAREHGVPPAAGSS